MNQHAPPRLLTGVALLFWGGLTGSPILGLLAAVLLEARSWASLRWEFSRVSYVRAWHFSVICALLLAVVSWLNGMKVGRIHTLFVWAPLTLLPIELAQRYGKAALIPLNTFSFFARRKMELDLKNGHHTNPRMINTGYIYLAIVLLATAVASRNEIQHFVGLAIIFGACLLFNARHNGLRPLAWLAAFATIITFSYAGHWGLFKLYQHYGQGGDATEDSRHTSANEARTSIGKLGRLKLSPNIFWRMSVADDNTPQLLRTATYNNYSRAVWRNIPSPTEEDSLIKDDGFMDETRIELGTGRDIRVFKQTSSDTPNITGNPTVRLVGEVDSAVIANPIPMPHFTQAVGDLGKESEVSLECNELGTVRIINPDYNVVSYSIWLGDESTTETAPNQRHDYDLPPEERAAVRRVCDELGLEKGMSAEKIVLRLRSHFSNKFKYTTHLTTPGLRKNTRGTAIGRFLESSRRGHCEYFATATALILRECGVPARYCVGFAVTEFDSERDEWVMRGKHAHAWVRVWNRDHWEDVDLTPPSWESLEEANASAWQLQLVDWWQRLREDFLIWRTQDENKTKTAVVAGALLALLLAWIAWRLWKSRQRGEKKGPKARYQRPKGTPQTALNKLERRIARKIGPRPEGQPLCDWVRLLEAKDPSLQSIIAPLTQLHSEVRFDPEHSSEEHAAKITELSAALKKRLKTMPA
ncbi:transglutaminase domain-containing protein [Verrucomicrobiaceae bacterium R5-34]|nr:transglutaminase domain-containing protein [Verrucomicrobiaceae bacterium R5-34]